MSLRIGRLTAVAGLILLLTLIGATTASFAQSGKPEYDADVEAVARTMFLELLSPY
jgi:hypothetical protein